MINIHINRKCTFCDQYVERTTPNFWAAKWGRKYGQTSDVIYESNYFLVVAGLGALLEGYVLLIAKTHYLSIAKLPQLMIDDLESLKRCIRSAIEESYTSSVVFFEHGAITESKRAGCCIDHVHIHAFPCEIDLKPTLEKHLPKENQIHSLKELSKFAKTNLPYIFYENKSGEMFVYETQVRMPSQFVRKIWAEAIERSDEWDWALFTGEKEVANTITTLKSVFQDHKIVLAHAT